MQSLGRNYSDKVEEGIALLEGKVFRLGEHYGQMWFLVSGYGMLRSAFAPHELKVHVQGMVDRLTKLFHEVTGSQEISPNEHTAAGALAALAGPNGNLLTVSSEGWFIVLVTILNDHDRLLMFRCRWVICRWTAFHFKASIFRGRSSMRFGP